MTVVENKIMKSLIEPALPCSALPCLTEPAKPPLWQKRIMSEPFLGWGYVRFRSFGTRVLVRGFSKEYAAAYIPGSYRNNNEEIS